MEKGKTPAIFFSDRKKFFHLVAASQQQHKSHPAKKKDKTDFYFI